MCLSWPRDQRSTGFGGHIVGSIGVSGLIELGLPIATLLLLGILLRRRRFAPSDDVTS